MKEIFVLVELSGRIVKAFVTEADAEKAVTGVNYGVRPDILLALKSSCPVRGALREYELDNGTSLYLVRVEVWEP